MNSAMNSLYAARRRPQPHHDGLSLGATCSGSAGWCFLILASWLWQGLAGLFARRFHRDDASAGLRRRLLNPIIGSLMSRSCG